MRQYVFAFLPLALTGCGRSASPPTSPPPTALAPVLGRTFPLTDVSGPADGTGIAGRIDHAGYDPATGRLFVACVANGTVEVIDLGEGKRVGRLLGLKEPQGVGVTGGKAFVSTGGDGRLHRFDTRTLAEERSVPVGDDADNVRVGPDGTVWVSFGGKGPGGLAPFDPVTLAAGKVVALERMPESFRLDPAGGRAFVNLPAGKRSSEDGTVLALDVPGGEKRWARKLEGKAGNFPLSLDPVGGRVFVATRRPARLVVLSASDGSIQGEVDCPAESDDLFFDPGSGRVLVIGGGNLPAGGDPGGAGASLDLFSIDAAGRPTRSGGTPLPPHARTGLLVPDRQAVYVGVPAAGGRAAEVREYLIPRPGE